MINLLLLRFSLNTALFLCEGEERHSRLVPSLILKQSYVKGMRTMLLEEHLKL